MFLQWPNWLPVQGDKSTNKRAYGTENASWHQATSTYPSPSCKLSLLTWITSRRDSKRTVCVCVCVYVCVCVCVSVCVLELIVPPCFFRLKHVWLHVQSTQSTNSSYERKINQSLWNANIFTWNIRNYHVFCTAVSELVDNIKTYASNKLEFFNLFLHNIVKWLQNLLNKVSFVKVCWNCSFWSQFWKKNCNFPVSEGPTNDTKTGFFYRNELFHKLGEDEKYPAAVQNFSIQAADRPQVLTDCPETPKNVQQNDKLLR